MAGHMINHATKFEDSTTIRSRVTLTFVLEQLSYMAGQVTNLEAISWGKIKKTASPVKVYGEASFIFPLLVGETFARRSKAFKN